MAIGPDEKDPTVETAGDKAHRVARALIGALPYFSGTVLEIFNAVIEPPIERRKAKWMVKVSESIAELQEKYNLKIESLAENEHFISILLHAYSLAIRNHQDEKINALKNSLINSVINQGISHDVQFAFLNLIDEFTPTHLKVLSDVQSGLCWSPVVSFRNYNVELEFSRILLREYSEFNNQGDFIYQIINDLKLKNLLVTFPVRIVNRFNNGDLQVLGSSEWGQVISLKPDKCVLLDESKQIYLTIPSNLGIDFLNYMFSKNVKAT
jgi:hypothetical protein